MPMAENDKQAEYQKRYEEKRVVKKVSFNLDKDKEILEFVENKDFSNTVKELLKKEIQAVDNIMDTK